MRSSRGRALDVAAFDTFTRSNVCLHYHAETWQLSLEQESLASLLETTDDYGIFEGFSAANNVHDMSFCCHLLKYVSADLASKLHVVPARHSAENKPGCQVFIRAVP